MESRKITLVLTKTQSKQVIMSSAETLAELKSDLTNAGIDYRDMTFFEGVSRTELKDDLSILPKDVPYKGAITNELVFMLTTANKKISSGAGERPSLYDKIRKEGLAASILAHFGRNFTQVSTQELLTFMSKRLSKNPEKVVEKKIEHTYSKSSSEIPVANNTPVKGDLEKRVESLYILFFDLISELNEEGNLNDEVADTFLSKLSEGITEKPEVNKTTSSYSSSEIDNMFNFLGR